MKVLVTTGAKTRTNQHSACFTGKMPFVSPNQQHQSTEGKLITFHGLAYFYLGASVFVLTTKGCWLPWREGCLASHQPFGASTP